MAAHEAPDAILTRLEAGWLRARALELVAELDAIPITGDDHKDMQAFLRWAGSASVILAELARG